MPGQFTAEKYMKRQKNAEKEKETLDAVKNIREQAHSEEREEQHFREEQREKTIENE